MPVLLFTDNFTQKLVLYQPEYMTQTMYVYQPLTMGVAWGFEGVHMQGQRLDLRIPKVLQTKGICSSEMLYPEFSTRYFQLINKYKRKCKYKLSNFFLLKCVIGKVQCLREKIKTATSSRRFQAKGETCLTFRAQLFEGRLALNPGLNLTRVSNSCV